MIKLNDGGLKITFKGFNTKLAVGLYHTGCQNNHVILIVIEMVPQTDVTYAKIWYTRVKYKPITNMWMF